MKTKTCKRCGKRRVISKYVKNKRYKDGYATWCKDCRIDYWKAYITNPEKKTKRNTYEKEWYKENKERITPVRRERDKERWANDTEYREKKNKWKRDKYHSDPDYRIKKLDYDSTRIRLRRQTIEATGTSFTVKEWKDLCAKYNHKCLKCKKVKRLTPDHVIPISRGGLNNIANIQPLCLKCNMEKHAKTIDYR